MENEKTMRGLSVERINWIVEYLKGKDVTKNDLKDFFTIQNLEEKVIVTENSKKNEYTYELNRGLCFDVILEKVKNLKITYTIKDIAFRLKHSEGV